MGSSHTRKSDPLMVHPLLPVLLTLLADFDPLLVDVEHGFVDHRLPQELQMQVQPLIPEKGTKASGSTQLIRGQPPKKPERPTHWGPEQKQGRIHDCPCRGRLGRGSNKLGRGRNEMGRGINNHSNTRAILPSNSSKTPKK